MSQTRSIKVETDRESYPIYIGSGLGEQLKAELWSLREKGARLAAFIDSKVLASHGDWVSENLGGASVYEVPSGETSKNLERFADAMDFLASENLDRGGVAIAVGGGVVGDLTGFAAASYLRGIRFIQVPTTLLSMVDSSVGGKTGVNISAGKNLVGAFHQPISVYADIAMLDTLSHREFISGMAEVIKYGLISDAAFFEKLERKPLTRPQDPRMAEVVEHNCLIKAAVVKADEKEKAFTGGRAILNLGHTFGHAIENVAGYGDYLHGEAIAIGMVAAARLSSELGYIPQEDVERTKAAFDAHGLPTELKESLPMADLMGAMYKDKKVAAGKLRFVVMERIGKAITQGNIDTSLIEKIWKTVGVGG
ncbi:MAG: 3-dehydroquinate synthase [Verrucomicrobiota bacterium]